MKKKLFLLMLLPTLGFAQTEVNSKPTTQPFNNQSRLFKDWSISVGGGAAFMKDADVTSFYGGKVNWGWNGYVSLDKQITHVFGLSLMYTRGQTNQKAYLDDKAGVGHGYTKFDHIALLGDVNFSNLMRRTDNRSNFKWALHGYAGMGLLGYKTFLQDNNVLNNWPLQIEQKIGISSFSYLTGLGLKYNVSKLLDVELRTLYLISGDEEFDGGGWTREAAPGYNLINGSYSDNAWMVNLGVSFKLGKHPEHLRWVDPLQLLFAKADAIEDKVKDLNICEKGDKDNDGVCDDWDRQLDTPAGARVDGAGVALDVDLDGVIDLYDKCVTVPGPIENNGCPVEKTPAVITKEIVVKEVNKHFTGIEFELNSDVIREKSFEDLNQAANVIKSIDGGAGYLVIGATDTRGSAAYNKKLSQSRANAVVKYLVDKGVPSKTLTAEGRGKDDLKYPECNPATKCPEWKNEANRRVYFIAK